MKIQIHQSILVKPLEQVSKVLPSKSTIPILSNIFFRADEEGLTLIAGDVSVFIKSLIPEEEIKIERRGSITLPGRKITDIIKKMSGEITIETRGLEATIKNGKSKFELSGIDAVEYPEFPSVLGETVQLQGETLRRNIAQTIYATSDKEAEGILTGVLFKLSTGNIQFIGCDRRRLAQKNAEIENELDFNVVISRDSLNELVKIIVDKENVELQLSTDKLLAKTKNYTFFSRVLEGSYPDVSRMIPTDFKSTISVNTAELIDSLERVFIVANEDKTKIVKMTFGDVVRIESEASKSKVSEQLDALDKTGEDFKISFNSKYALDVLKAIDHTETIIHFVGDARPLIFTGKDDDTALHLILPYLQKNQ